MPVIILVTTKNVREANDIATKLVEAKLIACANVINGIHSIYRWKGKVQKDSEALMVIKTKKVNIAKVTRMVKQWHSYENPEVVALPIAGGSSMYLKWIKENC